MSATFPPYWGGTGNVAFHNARILAAKGHDVTVFTSATLSSASDAYPFTVRGLKPLFRLGNAPFVPQLLWSLRGFDIIHLHYPFIFGAEMTCLSALRTRTPLVVTFHNRPQSPSVIRGRLFDLYNRYVEPTVLARADLRLAVSQDHVEQSGFPSHKWAEVSNGVDTDHFRPYPRTEARKRLGWVDTDPIVLFVGAMDTAHWFKNVEGLISAMGTTPHNVTLWLVGDGGERAKFEILAARLGISSRVRFWGRVPLSTLPLIYSAADLTVLPSTKVESFGMVLIESMACGTPVLATELPGVRAVVDHGMNGILTPPGQGDLLAAAINSLLHSPSRLLTMGLAGRDKAVAQYSWDVIGDKLEALYLRTLQKSKQSPVRSDLLSRGVSP